VTHQGQQQLEGKYSLESTDPRESEIRARRQLTIAFKLSYYLFIIAKLFKVKDGCLKFVYNIKKPRFTAFLDSNLHTRLAIVTENELGKVSRGKSPALESPALVCLSVCLSVCLFVCYHDN